MLIRGLKEIQGTAIMLAPLEDVTDISFRMICKEQGADIMYSEFISAEGLIREADKSTKKLYFEEAERPIGIQIVGHEAEAMAGAAREAAKVHPDIIDINWGCPVRKVVSKGAGSGIMNNIPKMVEITSQVVKATNLPVTVKTRLGWDESSKQIVDIAERLQDVGIAAITIHGRTRAQLYTGKADWTLIGAVKNNPRMHIPVIGNGDITSAAIASEMIDKHGVDGVMIGRAAIGYPWIFKEIKAYLKDKTILPEPTIDERIATSTRHFIHAIEVKGPKRAVLEMRKFYSNYFKGIANFKPFKIRLMAAVDPQEVLKILAEIQVLGSSTLL
jgi:nifR3 family TIM-barrel protein